MVLTTVNRKKEILNINPCLVWLNRKLKLMLIFSSYARDFRSTYAPLCIITQDDVNAVVAGVGAALVELSRLIGVWLLECNVYDVFATVWIHH